MKRNKRIFLSPPHMSGAEGVFVRDAFDSNYVSSVGPMLASFEEEFARYIDVPHCVAVSSGTAVSSGSPA